MAAPGRLEPDLAAAVEGIGGAWDALRGARILVSGASGFVGRWMLACLGMADRERSLGAWVVALSRDPSTSASAAPLGPHPRSLTWIRGDVRSFGFPEGAFTHVVHAAAAADARAHRDDPLATIDTIVSGTRRMLDFAVAAGARRFLFVSSGAVHGDADGPVAEDDRRGPDPLAAGSAYGEAKRLAEQLCAAYARAHGIEAVVARGWAFVGPGLPLDGSFAAGNFIADALAGRPIRVRGDGAAVRSYLYAPDMAEWLWRAALLGAPCRAYQVGSAQPVTILELAHLVAGCCEPRPAVEVDGAAGRASARRYVPDVGRSARELGAVARTGLEDALRKTIAWHRQGP